MRRCLTTGTRNATRVIITTAAFAWASVLGLAHPVLAQETDPGKTARQAGRSPVKVFILAGQSNMEGCGAVREVGEEGKAQRPEREPDPPKPTARTARKIEGWTVLVDDRLLQPPNDALGALSLRFLESRLADINAVVAKDALAKLHAVTIVLDWTHGKLRSMQYHPDAGWLKEHGYSTDLAKCVHIPEAADLPTRRNIREQPWVVLHELAHAYHDQVLGFDDRRIRVAYEAFKRSGHRRRARSARCGPRG